MHRLLLGALLVVLLVAPSASGGMYFPPAPDAHPAWSPDGSVIVYAHEADQTLHVVNPEGSGDRVLSGLPNTQSFAFSRDWHWIALSIFQGAPNSSQVEVMRPDGSDRRVVATNAVGAEPAFSPDGTRIAYAASDSIWTVGIDGSAARRISSETGNELTWSPDGRSVAFAVLSDQPHVAVAQSDGSGTGDFAAPSTGPSWSPSGDLAYYSNLSRPTLVVRSRSSDVGTSYLLTGTWVSPRPIWAPSGRAIYVTGRSLYRLDLATAKATTIGPTSTDIALSPDGLRFAYGAAGVCGDRTGIYVDGKRITSDCHVYGTNGSDVLYSSPVLYEIVEGLGGNDTLIARGAAYIGDELDGGDGDDVLRGGFWAERLEGGNGDDTIYGGANGDTITGGRGHDRLNGEGGRDRIFARDGARDVVDCGTNKGRTNKSGENDKAYVDRFDVERNCENVYRSR